MQLFFFEGLSEYKGDIYDEKVATRKSEIAEDAIHWVASIQIVDNWIAIESNHDASEDLHL